MCELLLAAAYFKDSNVNMTIPSRPAPPPPQSLQQQQQQSQYGSTATFSVKLPPPPSGSASASNSFRYSKTTTSSSVTRHFPAAKTRYAPITNWDGASFDIAQMNNINNGAKKAPPPRPPPPKLAPKMTGNTVLKKPGPPQSINVLSNLFGRRKPNGTKKHQQLPQQQHYQHTTSMPKIPTFPLNTILPNNEVSRPSSVPVAEQPKHQTDLQLINFDSPPSSPTLTQKSNSDCVSVDSFSSDSNFSSPNNGSVSQPESGFEDDFTSPLGGDPWEQFTNNLQNFNNDIKITQPVRNINVINRTQNENPLCNGKSLLPPQETLAMPTIIRPKTTTTSQQNSNNVSPIHSVFSTAPQQSYSPSLFKNNNVSQLETYEYNNSLMETTSYPSLPMPSCPPPPPPANILDVVNGQLDALDLHSDISDTIQQPYGIALYDFEGTQDGDLSFKENEKIYLIQRLNDEWYFGRNKRGCEGMFPSTYIDVKVPLDSISTSSCNSQPNHHKVKALYDFPAEAEEDLSLKANDVVTVLYRINEDWLYGEIGNRKGQFPANFLEYIPENLLQK